MSFPNFAVDEHGRITHILNPNKPGWIPFVPKAGDTMLGLPVVEADLGITGTYEIVIGSWDDMKLELDDGRAV